MKIIIKKILDIIFELLNRFGCLKTIKTNFNYHIYKTDYKHTFFGYYDKTSFNYDNTKLLAIATNHDTIITKAEEAIVGYFDVKTKKFKEIDKTTTWCWQQGCRLMWCDNNSFLYNKVVEGDYGSIIYDIEKEEEIKRYNFAIYDKTSDNKLALSLNFSRLQYFRPGYGYCNFLKEEDKQKVLEMDGVYLCSLENNTKELLISLPEIISIEKDERMQDAYHYINHLKFSPDDKHFIFYHIWNKNNKRYTRAIFANLDGEVLKVFDNQTFLSHYVFKNLNKILIFTKTNQNGYHLYDLKNDSYQIIYNQLQEDGHPSFLDDMHIITDTYPNKFTRNQKIISFNKHKMNVLAQIYSPSKYKGEFRCDLHPRLSGNKKLLCIDTPTFEGRTIMTMELNYVTP